MNGKTIIEMQTMLQSGETTSRSLVEKYLARIAAIDKAGPQINAVIELNPDALQIADQLDTERQIGHVRGPLHGIPVLIKDNIDTHDRMTTTAGSLALEGSIPPQDAFIVQKLRESGAILLGKSNLSEWANFRSTRSTSGWSSRGGQTKNPHVLNRTPCGSSSGSGAGVAADLCAAAVGTETFGSIICPATANGIVGIKPTVGLVSRSGIIPIAHSHDTAGPMARSVVDAAVLLGALTGVDVEDLATVESVGRGFEDYTPFLSLDGLQGARIGVARNCFGNNPRATRIVEAAIEVMKDMGAEVIDPVNLHNEGKLWKAQVEVLLYEFRSGLNAYLRKLSPKARVHNLAEVIAFNQRHADRVMPYFDQERMLMAHAKRDLRTKKYLNALERVQRLSREDGIDAAMKEHNLDAIFTQAGPLPWLIDLINGDSFGRGGSGLAAAAGYPIITLPAGYHRGLPVGISFTAGAWQEPTLIRLAYAFEQATKVYRHPQFLPEADLDSD